MVAKDTYKWILILLAGAIIIASLYGALTWNFGQVGLPGPSPTLPPGATPTPVPEETIRAATAKWNIRTAVDKSPAVAGDTGYVGVARADANGIFDLLNHVEKTELDAVPDTSSGTYSTGDKLLISVTSDDDITGGNETYPRWFYIDYLDHNAVIYALPLVNPISALVEYKDGSYYKYSVNKALCEDTGERVIWLEGNTNYWIFGNYFELYARVGLADMIIQITNKGVVGCTFNDGASWEDTDGEINANFTFTSDQEDLYFELVGEKSNVAYALPTLAVTASGQVKQYNAVLVFTTDATGLDVQPLLDDGWVQLDKPDLTADVGFYYVIDPVADGCIPSQGGIISLKIPISISDAGLTASTEYEFEGWVLDWQNEVNVARGTTTTSLPSNNGFISDPGCDTVIDALALTVSSGSAATMQLLGHYTTNA